MRARRLRAAALVLLSACTAARADVDSPAGSSGVQAALAVVTVENRTAAEVAISVRPVGQQRAIVTIGRVPAGATRRLPPVPASEPIVLRALRADSALLELPARTFRVDEEWLWVIPADARFYPRQEP